MTDFTHLRRLQYAVIEARYDTEKSERLVIAYSREKSLRDFISGARIIASGISTSELAARVVTSRGTPEGKCRHWMRKLGTSISGSVAVMVRFSRALPYERKRLLADV